MVLPVVLVTLLAAAPKVGSTLRVSLEAQEHLVVRRKNQVAREDHTYALKGVVKVEAASTKPDVVSVQPSGKDQELSPFTVSDDSGAPVLVFKGEPPRNAVLQVLRGALGRLVVADPERDAMSRCTDETEAATSRWLAVAIARINNSQPDEVALSELTVTCTATRGGTRLAVAFTAHLPRSMLNIVVQPKGTLTVDRAAWATQWSLEGPVFVSGGKDTDLTIEGTFASSLKLTP